ncbi:hypothetical protein AGMMS50296_5610 [Alphaproteobacteria bacterium]|nr:hypothetical protein AGMMS50296_5610 [Alphaproteobacteria bacterium]
MIEYRGIMFDRGKCELTEDILKAIESVFFRSSSLPKDFRNFLLAVNGGVPNRQHIDFIEKDGFKNGEWIECVLGVTSREYSNLLLYNTNYSKRIPANMICITRNCGANLMLLSIVGKDRGNIYFWNHDTEANNGEIPNYDNLTLIANSFDEFLSKLYSENEAH